VVAFTDISTGTVTGRFVTGDGPDVEPLAGTVTFQPQGPLVLVATAAPPTTLFPASVTVELDADGAFSEVLFATDDPDGNPIDWTWTAVFRLETLDGDPVTRPAFPFALPTGTTVDLTLASPIETSPGEFTTASGPAGPPGPIGPIGPTGTPGANGTNGTNGQSVTVILVPSASWPPAADPDPLHFYVRT
jgi:hypothetical protein